MNGNTIRLAQLVPVVIAIVLTMATKAGAADAPQVLQLAPLEAGMCVAVRIPVAQDQAVCGLSWYNNDGSLAFPEMLVVAGYDGIAPSLANAIVLLESVQGGELDWSAVDFGQDVVSPTGVFYVIFRLPEFSGEQGPGQGPGIGYEDVEEESSVFIKADGEGWVRMVSDKRLLVDPIYANGEAKSAAGGRRPVLVLAAPAVASEDGEVVETVMVPVSTELLAPYPNPFNPQVTIAYTLREPAEVRISVYDVRGRRVRSFDIGVKPAGEHAEVWYGRDDGDRKQASGVYFVRLKAGQYEKTMRLLLMK